MLGQPEVLTSRPEWIGVAARRVFDEEALAFYYSWRHGGEEARAIIVAANALIGLTMTFVEHSYSVVDVVRSSVALEQVKEVSLSTRLGIQETARDLETMGTRLHVGIELTYPLGEFGDTIDLPLSKEDYAGNEQVAESAAEAVANAILKRQGATR
jgi:hypothetical protein